jgi:hypothetical protein
MSTPVRQISRARRPVAPPGQIARRATPFDYAFRYQLLGRPGKVSNSTVTISVEATFTAVSIGYGVVPKVQPIIFGPPPPPPPPTATLLVNLPPPPTSLRSISLDAIVQSLDAALANTSRTLRGETGSEAVFRNGIKLNPEVAEFALQNGGNRPLPNDILARLFQVVSSPSELVQFKYALFDEGSGREFQSEPILNIAGLGSANGERPFRYFARPIIFKPKSTIRMEVTEVSDFTGELHVSLHGYKVLGEPNSPIALAQRRAARGRRR